jgi:hypothetical protein
MVKLCVHGYCLGMICGTIFWPPPPLPAQAQCPTCPVMGRPVRPEEMPDPNFRLAPAGAPTVRDQLVADQADQLDTSRMVVQGPIRNAIARRIDAGTAARFGFVPGSQFVWNPRFGGWVVVQPWGQPTWPVQPWVQPSPFPTWQQPWVQPAPFPTWQQPRIDVQNRIDLQLRQEPRFRFDPRVGQLDTQQEAFPGAGPQGGQFIAYTTPAGQPIPSSIDGIPVAGGTGPPVWTGGGQTGQQQAFQPQQQGFPGPIPGGMAPQGGL